MDVSMTWNFSYLRVCFFRLEEFGSGITASAKICSSSLVEEMRKASSMDVGYRATCPRH